MSDAAPQPRSNQGNPEPRIDARLKVTGQARYAADIPLNNLAYGVLVTSDIARGRVTSVNAEDAKATRGFLDIVTYGDADHLNAPRFGTGSYTALAPLREPKIWHDGQIVGLVVAETFEAATEAASRVRVKYQADQPSANLDSSGTEEIEAAGNTQRLKKNPSVGDFASAFRSAPVSLEAEYSTPTQTHNPMELFSTTAAWVDGQLTIYEPTQNLYGFRGEAAHQLRMDVADIRVVASYVGGGFGSKGPIMPRTAIVALAAKRLNRPVRCVVTREQAYTTQSYRAPTRHRIRMGATQDGRITAFSHEGWELTSRIDNYVVAGTQTTTRMYGWSNVASDVRFVRADRQTPAYMRSPPELLYMFPLECAIDELAYWLGKDPVELRRINDTQKDPIDGKPFSTRGLMACFDAAGRAKSPARLDAGRRLARRHGLCCIRLPDQCGGRDRAGSPA